MKLDSPALSPLTSTQKTTLLFSQGADHANSFRWSWRVIYSVNFCLCSYDFHGRSYLFREELESRQGSLGIGWRLSLTSRVRSSAGRKRHTQASRRLGQARTMLTVLLRKNDVVGREENYKSWKLAWLKNWVTTKWPWPIKVQQEVGICW